MSRDKHVINTCTHYVLPKQWYPEQSCQYRQGASHPRKHVSEATTLCAEAGKGSSTHDAMWVTTQDVVLVWTQLGCLHQLSKKIHKTINRADHGKILWWIIETNPL